MQKPLDIGLNIAVRTIAAKLFPCGFDITADETAAPSTLEALNAHIAATGRMLVWSGASDRTIFADAETNWAFRAWYDWHHWRFQLPFNAQGERAVALGQMQDIETVYGHGPKSQRWQRLVYIEVVEQALLFETTGAFPVDQMQFAIERLAA